MQKRRHCFVNCHILNKHNKKCNKTKEKARNGTRLYKKKTAGRDFAQTVFLYMVLYFQI